MPSGKSIKNLKTLHRYLGLLFAPSILFFAFSGGLQVFNLHKPDKTSGYIPPTWVLEMAQVHKSQTLSISKKTTKTAQADSGTADPETDKHSTQVTKSKLPLQIFFAVMSAGLMITTLLGIYMAFPYGGKPWLIWSSLLAGTAIPIAMLVL